MYWKQVNLIRREENKKIELNLCIPVEYQFNEAQGSSKSGSVQISNQALCVYTTVWMWILYKHHTTLKSDPEAQMTTSFRIHLVYGSLEQLLSWVKSGDWYYSKA